MAGWFLVLVLLGDPAGAAAQRDNDLPAQRKAEARAFYERGLQHYNLAEYDQAIAAFKRSYELSNAPELLFNIGQALRFKGDCQQAVLVYRSYLRETSDRANRAKAETAIERCSNRQERSPLPQEQPRQPPPTSAVATTQTSPGAAPSAMMPSSLPLSGSPVPAASVSRTGQRPPVWPPPNLESWLGLGAGGLGVGLLSVAVVLGLEARSAEKEVGDAFTAGVTWTDQLKQREQSGRNAARAANVLIGVGAAALVGGGVLYYLGLRRNAASAEMTMVLAPGGVVTALGGRF